MPTISSASVRLTTTATDTVAPSTISAPLLLLLPRRALLTSWSRFGRPAAPMENLVRDHGRPTGAASAAPQKSLRGSWRLLRVVAGAGEIEGAGGVEGQAGVAGEAAVQQDGVGVAVGAGLPD